MNHESVLAKHYCVVTLFLSVVFAAMYTQAPLYDSNQNSYFLHGLSDGRLGFLSNDWMATTTDPFPVFSVLVELTYRELHPHFFYFYYFSLLVIFSYTVLGIASKTWRIDRSLSSYILYALSVTAVASPVFSRMTTRLTGVGASAAFRWSCRTVSSRIDFSAKHVRRVVLCFGLSLHPEEAFLGRFTTGCNDKTHASYSHYCGIFDARIHDHRVRRRTEAEEG